MYQFKYSLSKDAYMDFNLHHAKHSPSVKKSFKLQRFLVPFLLLFIPFVLGKGSDKLFISIYVLLAILWAIFYPKFFYGFMKKRIVQMISESDNTELFGLHNLQLSVKGIHDHTINGDYSKTWNVVEKIEESNKNIFIYIGALEAIIIPKKEFTNETEKKSFLQFCMSQINIVEEKHNE